MPSEKEKAVKEWIERTPANNVRDLHKELACLPGSFDDLALYVYELKSIVSDYVTGEQL